MTTYVSASPLAVAALQAMTAPWVWLPPGAPTSRSGRLRVTSVELVPDNPYEGVQP